MQRLASHPIVAGLAGLVAVITALSVLLDFPAKVGGVWTALTDSPGGASSAVTATVLEGLDVDTDVGKFESVLGPPSLKEKIPDYYTEFTDAAPPDVDDWRIWRWSPPRDYEVVALLDGAGAVRAYQLTAYSTHIKPAIPIFGHNLTEATFADLQIPGEDETTGLVGREAASYANTTGPYYYEAYKFGNPFHQSIVISGGGLTSEDGTGDWEPPAPNPPIFSLAQQPLAGSIACVERCASMPTALRAYRGSAHPDTFLLLSDKINLDFAGAIGLY